LQRDSIQLTTYALSLLHQILTLQCLHYLVLSLIVPPLMMTLAFRRPALDFQGGPTSLAMILDWREIAGIPTLPSIAHTVDQKEVDHIKKVHLNSSQIDDMGGLNRWWEWDVYLQSDTLHWILDAQDEVAWNGKRPGREDAYRPSMAQASQESPQPISLDTGEAWWALLARDSSRSWTIVLAWAMTGAIE
jgi:hypothetical protein